jgi:hypothetical protein
MLIDISLKITYVNAIYSIQILTNFGNNMQIHCPIWVIVLQKRPLLSRRCLLHQYLEHQATWTTLEGPFIGVWQIISCALVEYQLYQ